MSICNAEKYGIQIRLSGYGLQIQILSAAGLQIRLSECLSPLSTNVLRGLVYSCFVYVFSKNISQASTFYNFATMNCYFAIGISILICIFAAEFIY